MATKHTTNYQLNLWEPNDAFVRTEFNENSNKLDAALHAHDAQMSTLESSLSTQVNALKSALDTKPSRTLIRTSSLSASAAQFSVSLSGIDWSQWEEVDIRFTLSGSGQVYARANNQNTGHCTYIGSSGAGSSMVAVFSLETTAKYYTARLLVEKNPSKIFECLFTGYGNFSYGHDDYIAFSKLTSLDLGKPTSSSSSAPTFNAGCKAEIFGMR